MRPQKYQEIIGLSRPILKNEGSVGIYDILQIKWEISVKWSFTVRNVKDMDKYLIPSTI